MNEVVLSGAVVPAVLPRDDPEAVLAMLTDAWLGSLESAHSVGAYRRDLRAWLSWCAARSVHPLGARLPDVSTWLAAQRDDGAARRSIARRLSAVRSWYDYLIVATAPETEPLIRHNPAAGAKRPDVDRDHSPTVGLTGAEADRLIAAADADSPRSSAIIRLMLTNAYRCGVIISLDIEHLGHDRGHRVFTTTVKGGHLKRDPIPPPTARAIDGYLKICGNPESGPLFATRSGKRLDHAYLFRLVRRLAASAKLDAAGQVSPHSLRRTAITETLVATHDLAKAQDLAGHADPRTTRLYDDNRNQLDGHAAYVLATRYGAQSDQ